MAEKTDTPKVHQHLLSDDERSKWTVVDIAVVSPTSVTALLQNNQEWCIDTFDYNENEYQRSKRICLQTNLKEPPLLLSYLHVENKLKHFVSTKTKLHLIDDESESIEKSVSLSAEPSALCVEDNKVYISTNETKTLMFFKLELPTDTSKIYLNDISKHDSIAEFVVHSKNIYVCTKGGKVSSHKETGEKQHDYRNRKSRNYKARGLAVFTSQGKDCNLLLVTWSDNTLYIYSTKSNHDLLDIDLNVPGKIRVTTSCFLMSSEVNDVAVYNMKSVADRGTFKMILVSGNRDEDAGYLVDYVFHYITTVAPLSRNFMIKRKNLTTLVEMYDYSCIKNDNLNAEKKKLKDEIDRSKKERDDLTEELKNARSNLSRKEADLSDAKAKLDDARTESDEIRSKNEEKEQKCCSLTNQLEAERKATEDASIEIVLKNEIERSKKERDDVTEELENTRSNLSRNEADLSDVKAKLDDARTESSDLRRKNEENEEKCCDLTKQLEAERKATEEARTEINDLRRKNEENEEICRSLTKQLEAERQATGEARTEINDLRRKNEENEDKCRSLTKQLEAERQANEEGGITKDTVAVSTENMKTDLRGLIDGILDDTLELTKQKNDVTEELELTKSTLTKKEVDLLQIQVELDAAISKQMDLNKTVTKTEELYQIIEDKKREIQQLRMRLKKAQTEVENAKTQVTILQDRKQELEKSLSREQKRSKDFEKFLLNLNEKINEVQFTKKEMESQQNKLKNTLVQEKGKVTLEERSRVQLKERIKDLEVTRKELESQWKKLKDNLVQEKGKVAREERSRVQVVINLKKVEDRNTKLEYEVTNLKERLLVEEMTAKELQTSSTKLIERIKELEGIITALESQQKKMKDNLVQEKGKLTREERSRVQLNERTKELEFARKELESQQKKLKENLVQEKRKVSRVERSRVQLIKQIKELELTRTELESQRKKLKGNLVQEKGKVARKEKSRVQAVTNLKKVEEINTKLEDRVTQLKDRLLAEELSPKDLQTSLLKAQTEVKNANRQFNILQDREHQLRCILEDLDRDALILKRESEVFKEILQTEGTQEDVLVCLQSESSEKLKVLQQSAFLESVDALVKEISNGKSKLGKLKNNRDRNVEESEVQRDWFELSELQVSMVVSQDGGKLVIPGSDVSLDIPPGALQEQREIQMKIIPHCLDPGCDSLSFSSNSSVVVELLPNNLQFQRTVHLRLPHCLHLNDKYNSLTDVEVLISHHEKGDTPKWDASTDTSCKLQKDHCVVRLNTFCWITYRVHDKVVTAKRLKIFTAGRDLELSDRVSEVEVGYFPDLPGSGEILRKNPNFSRGQIKPFLFQKNEEESTLLISLQQVIPTEWKNNIELGDQQIISYQSICTGTEMSCPFHLQYTPEGSPSGKVPLCLFHITQKNAEQIHITFRPEVKCDED